MKRISVAVFSTIAMLFILAMVSTVVAQERDKGTKQSVPRETSAARVFGIQQPEAVSSSPSWEGVGRVIIDQVGVVEIVPGEEMRRKTMGFDLHWGAAELAEAAQEGKAEHHYQGVVTVAYDAMRRAWFVSVDGEVLVDFTRPASVTIDEEIAYLRSVQVFFGHYLVTDEEDEPVNVTAAPCPPNQTCCTPGNSCCIAGQGEAQVRADCTPGSTPLCTCTTNQNGTVCTARCRAIMV